MAGFLFDVAATLFMWVVAVGVIVLAGWLTETHSPRLSRFVDWVDRKCLGGTHL